MTPDDRSETLDILSRLAGVGEPPEAMEDRQEILLGLTHAEAALEGILEHSQPRHRGGKVLLDPEMGRRSATRTQTAAHAPCSAGSSSSAPS